MVKPTAEKLASSKYQTRQELQYTQKGCPVCGKSVRRQGDLHHWLIRRSPDRIELYHPINMVLVCNPCHVPESPSLGILSARKKLEVYTPKEIEAWVAELDEGFTVERGKSLPDFWHQAKEEYYGLGMRNTNVSTC